MNNFLSIVTLFIERTGHKIFHRNQNVLRDSAKHVGIFGETRDDFR